MPPKRNKKSKASAVGTNTGTFNFGAQTTKENGKTSAQKSTEDMDAANAQQSTNEEGVQLEAEIRGAQAKLRSRKVTVDAPGTSLAFLQGPASSTRSARQMQPSVALGSGTTVAEIGHPPSITVPQPAAGAQAGLPSDSEQAMDDFMTHAEQPSLSTTPLLPSDDEEVEIISTPTPIKTSNQTIVLTVVDYNPKKGPAESSLKTKYYLKTRVISKKDGLFIRLHEAIPSVLQLNSPLKERGGHFARLDAQDLGTMVDIGSLSALGTAGKRVGALAHDVVNEMELDIGSNKNDVPQCQIYWYTSASSSKMSAVAESASSISMPPTAGTKDSLSTMHKPFHRDQTPPSIILVPDSSPDSKETKWHVKNLKKKRRDAFVLWLRGAIGAPSKPWNSGNLGISLERHLTALHLDKKLEDLGWKRSEGGGWIPPIDDDWGEDDPKHSRTEWVGLHFTQLETNEAMHVKTQTICEDHARFTHRHNEYLSDGFHEWCEDPARKSSQHNAKYGKMKLADFQRLRDSRVAAAKREKVERKQQERQAQLHREQGHKRRREGEDNEERGRLLKRGQPSSKPKYVYVDDDDVEIDDDDDE